jgi:hypothetical protein
MVSGTRLVANVMLYLCSYWCSEVMLTDAGIRISVVLLEFLNGGACVFSSIQNRVLPIPVAARSKAEGMDICLLCLYVVLSCVCRGL